MVDRPHQPCRQDDRPGSTGRHPRRRVARTRPVGFVGPSQAPSMITIAVPDPGSTCSRPPREATHGPSALLVGTSARRGDICRLRFSRPAARDGSYR
jgi:hypothetical protein